MPKYAVELSRIVRETVIITVSAERMKGVKERLNEVYDAYDGKGWRREAGSEHTHIVLGKANARAKIDVLVGYDGSVQRI